MRNLVVTFSLLILFAACSNLKKVENFSGNAIPGKLSEKQIIRGIKAGGATKGWVIKTAEDKEKTLLGTLNVRTHSVSVTIPYTKDSYDIVYESSDNMDYDSKKNMIHRNYLRWVINLRQAIDVNLAVQANE